MIGQTTMASKHSYGKKRTNDDHRRFADRSRLASTEAERNEVEQKFGARYYSELYRLAS